MKQYLGMALGLGVGTLLYDALHGHFDAAAWSRAAFAAVLSFVLLALIVPFTKRRRRRD